MSKARLQELERHIQQAKEIVQRLEAERDQLLEQMSIPGSIFGYPVQASDEPLTDVEEGKPIIEVETLRREGVKFRYADGKFQLLRDFDQAVDDAWKENLSDE